MISASEGESAPASGGAIAADACTVLAVAISKPRSIAAVLTLTSTPRRAGSCVFLSLGRAAEVFADESDRGLSAGLGSLAMCTNGGQRATATSSTGFTPLQDLGYHAARPAIKLSR